MKRPQPDIGDILHEGFIGNMATVRKMMRLWGTTNVGGHEVFNHRRYYYPSGSRPSNYEKLFRYLGAYDDTVDYSPEGVESAWLYLNKNQGSKRDPVDRTEATKTFVSQNLNHMWWNTLDGDLPSGLTLTATIIIEQDDNQASKYPTLTTVSDILALGLSKEDLKTSVASNYNDLWLTSRITQRGIGVIHKGTVTDPNTQVATPDEDDLTHQDPWMSTATRYALRSSGIPSSVVKSVSIGLGKDREFDKSRVDNTLVVNIEMPYTLFTEASPIVVAITSDLRANNFSAKPAGTWGSNYHHVTSVPNSEVTQKDIKAMDKSDLATNPNYVTRPYTLWENAVDLDNPAYSSLWHGGYLKTEAFRRPRDFGFTYEELSEYLLSLVDSDYEEEDNDASFFQKLVAVVIFVIAVIFAPVTGGFSLKLAVLATAIMVGVVTLAIFTLVLSAMGQHEWANAFASVSKAIEPLALIASIYLIFTSVLTKLAQTAATEGGKSALLRAGVDMAIDFVKDMVKDILKGATDMFSGKLTELSVKFATKLMDLVNMAQKNKLESINDRNKDLQAEYDKLLEETSMENDLLKGFMHIYAKPATADWSVFSSLYDMPYERSGGPLHIGNVQKTTKQALRKGIYNDPAFENILLV